MARGKTDVEQRPNTLKENKRVLCELRNRIKINQKSCKDFIKLIAKFNANCAPFVSKNAKASSSIKQDKISLEHLSVSQEKSQYGPVDGFPPGSWWGIRMDCSRDRVHEPFNKDIQEGPYGAVSLCTSHLNTSNDVDLGDYLTFTADEYVPGVQSLHPLLRSYENKVPLRLIRSYNLGNAYAPKTGYRYDGLYAVVFWWIGVISSSEKNYKFALMRLPNQEPAVWQSSLKIVNREKNSNLQRTTGHSVERISTNHQNSQNIENERKLRNNLRPRVIKTRTLSRKSTISELSRIDGSTRDLKRNSHASTIVTRCISNKKTDCSLGKPMISVGYPESSPSSLNRQLDDTSMSPLGKLQNTNISIRTDLYDSQQQDTRRITPMTFSRTFKNSRLPTRVTNHSNVVTLNLNSCGPCPRDNVQESLIQSRSGIGKIFNDQSPSFDNNRNNETSKSSTTTMETERIFHDEGIENCPVNSISSAENSPKLLNIVREGKTREGIFDEAKIDADKSPDAKIDTDEPADAQIDTDVSADAQIDADGSADAQIDADESADAIKSNAENIIRNSETLTTVAESTEKIDDTSNIETREEIVSKESRTDLDSLTPDQMLNFIVKQKYHPAAKLLIGSVIGLATGESTILRVYESLISRKNRWSREKNTRDSDDELTSISRKNDESANSQDSINLRSNVRNVGKSVSKNRTTNDNNDRMRNARHRRTRVSKRILGMDKKSSGINLRKSSTRDATKSQKPFSKSTILKKSKKRAKKRRGELANLVIDANVGPLVRGARNRRLRCTRHIFVKKRRPTKDVGNRASRSTKIVAKTRKNEVTLTPTKSTRSNLTEKERIDESSRTRKILDKPIARNCHEEREIRAKGEKRKLSVASGKRREIGESTKRLRNDDKKNVEMSRKKMVDAATQCASCRDAATSCVDREINENSGNIVKIEWIDLDDVKSEIESDDESSNDRSINDLVDDVRGNIGNSERRENFDETPRLSAFVPVNISSNDSRIARLRSIGFRPIEPAGDIGKKNSGKHDENFSSDDANVSLNDSAVMSREVDELFNKYTSEETTVVGYMDQELRYQDIENEEKSNNRKITRTTQIGAKRILNIDCGNKSNKDKPNDGEMNSSVEEDSDVPWHGWKKFINNKQEQWIGW